MDTPGVLTRRVLDCALLLDAMTSGADPRDATSVQRNPVGISVVSEVLQQLKPHVKSNYTTGTKLKPLHQLQELKRTENFVGKTLCGLVVGVPVEFSVSELDASVRECWEETLNYLHDAGAEIRTLSLPSLKTAIPSYYMIACAEASSNLSRYDGIRYGRRRSAGHPYQNANASPSGEDISMLHSAIGKIRGENFGPEVLRRILAG